MRYRNTKTGLTIVTDCRISGEDFVLIPEEGVKTEAPKAVKTEAKTEKPKTTTKRAKR